MHGKIPVFYALKIYSNNFLSVSVRSEPSTNIA